MLATDLLMDEHEQIVRVLDALDTYATTLGSGAAAPEDLGRFVEFLRGFADAAHHAKEEQLLFRELISTGYRSDSGPIAVFTAEHAHGRRLLGVLAAASSKSWGPDEIGEVQCAAREYVALLRRHIEKEDSVLFPMAEMTLGPDRLEQMQGDFERADEPFRTAGTAGRWEAIARELTGRYPAPSPAQRYRGAVPAKGEACQELCDRLDCMYGPGDELPPWRD